MSGGFELSTRNKIIRTPTISYPAGGGIAFQELPKTGYLARIYLSVSITVGGTVNTPNPAGIAAAIRRVRLYTNSGMDLINISGIGYGYMLNFTQELCGINGRQQQNQYNTAVSATTFNLDMVLPVMINLHDPVGLIMLQNEQLQTILSIEWETPTGIGGSTATITAGTVAVALEFFTVPEDEKDRPPLGMVHQIIEDQIAVASSAADVLYNAPRGNVYLQLLFGYGIKQAAVDNWSRLILRVNQSDILYDITPGLATQLHNYRYNIARGLGFIPMDFFSSDGLGAYGSARDFINSGQLTDFQAVLTPTATDTLYVVRRMLMPINQRKG